MKKSTLYYLIAFVSGSMFFLTVPSGMAATYFTPSTGPPITVELDRYVYNRGDIMFISGEINAIVNRVPLTIQVLDPNSNLVHIEQIEVASDGKFTLPVRIDGPLWSTPGNYTLVAQYGSKRVYTEVTFQFEENEIPTTGIFNVKDTPSGQNFDLNYTITGGKVKRMYLEPTNLTLVVEVESRDFGMITLPIPRLMLDAKKSNNVDESFLVYVNENETTAFHEKQGTSSYRVLEIPISPSDTRIEIIGTTIIPEFGSIAGVIITIAVIGSLVISRRFFSKL